MSQDIQSSRIKGYPLHILHIMDSIAQYSLNELRISNSLHAMHNSSVCRINLFQNKNIQHTHSKVEIAEGDASKRITRLATVASKAGVTCHAG